MRQYLAVLALLAPLFCVVAAEPASAQKPGGILRMYSPDSPASMSIHEEATFVAEGPMMGVFNNLVMFDQHVKQNSLDSIVPDLATGWSWNEDGTELTLPLREGVRWHDGKPFTAQDVRCTFDLLTGKSSDKLRVNPRKSWYRNLDAVTTNGGVSLLVPENYSAHLETGTVNGHINLDFPINLIGQIDRSIAVDLGSGGPLVRAITTNGGVSIHRKTT